MGRLKTSKKREDKKAEQRRSKKIARGNPYIETVTNPIDIKTLTPECAEFATRSIKRGHFLTRNSRCPCNSGKRFKSCCMELRRPDAR